MAGQVVTQDGYSTHQRMLVRYLMRAPEGSLIVELGCGNYSTPIISEIAKAKGLRFKVYYSEDQWKEQMEKLNPDVEFIKVNGWQHWKLEEEAFLVMLDNEELVVNRYKHIKRLKEKANFILVHDADIYPKRGINLRGEYQGEYDSSRVPNTMVIDCKAQSLPSAPDEPTPEEEDETSQDAPEQAVEDFTSNGKPKTAVVCCYVPGGDYDSHFLEYIRILANGVEQNTTDDVDFHCVTIMDLSMIPNVNRIQPLNDNWKGWHIKAEIFRPELWTEYDRVLYIDLDTVITNNIDDILSSWSKFSMLHDFYHPTKQETGMIYFDPKIVHGLYQNFCKKRPSKMIKDADIINKWLRIKKIAPQILQKNFRIGSYKVSILRDAGSHKDYQVICFHGNPRPHHVGWQLEPLKIQNMSKHAINNMRRQANKNVIEPVERIWDGEEVFIIGGGPSLTGIDLDCYLMDKKVLGINDGYQYKCCDVCYFGDTVWWNHHSERLKQFSGRIFSTSGVLDPTIHHLDVIGTGVSSEPTKLAFNCNSGMAGINLALLMGAKKIYLLGFDMSFGKAGESNWHKNIRNVNQNTYQVFLRNEKRLKNDMDIKFPDVEVFNVEIEEGISKMTVFPKIIFDDLFKDKTKEV